MAPKGRGGGAAGGKSEAARVGRGARGAAGKAPQAVVDQLSDGDDSSEREASGGDDYHPPVRKAPRTAAGKRSSTRHVDADQDEQGDGDAPGSSGDEEQPEEQGTVLSTMTVQQDVASSTQQVAEARHMEDYLRRMYKPVWGMTREEARHDVLLKKGIVGGVASFTWVCLKPRPSSPNPQFQTLKAPNPQPRTRTPKPHPSLNPEPIHPSLAPASTSNPILNPKPIQVRLDALSKFLSSMSAAAHAKFMRGYRFIFPSETTGISDSGALLSGIQPGQMRALLHYPSGDVTQQFFLHHVHVDDDAALEQAKQMLGPGGLTIEVPMARVASRTPCPDSRPSLLYPILCFILPKFACNPLLSPLHEILQFIVPPCHFRCCGPAWASLWGLLLLPWASTAPRLRLAALPFLLPAPLLPAPPPLLPHLVIPKSSTLIPTSYTLIPEPQLPHGPTVHPEPVPLHPTIIFSQSTTNINNANAKY